VAVLGTAVLGVAVLGTAVLEPGTASVSPALGCTALSKKSTTRELYTA
jgi:hypothetical protein